MAMRAGDWVEVRSKEEILRSLDKNGRFEELPFMPQMFQYCGKRFRVVKRAHKTCDTTAVKMVERRLADAVHLELRCDGKAYGGCQAACLIFWKEAWLRQVKEEARAGEISPRGGDEQVNEAYCGEEDVWKATRVQDHQPGEEPTYSCQATRLPYFTTPLRWWDVRQYVEDYASGNVTLGRILCGFIYVCYYHFTLARRNRLGGPARWVYDQFQALLGGVPFPRRKGSIPAGQPTPVCALNLQTGELVQVKSYKEILATLNGVQNRGMNFDAELVPYCGGVYRVKARVERFINEKSGRMASMKTPAVMLENVWCQARYSDCRMFCPRAIYPWWREIWLRRVPERTTIDNSQA
jgi:hypothetical protein